MYMCELLVNKSSSFCVYRFQWFMWWATYCGHTTSSCTPTCRTWRRSLIKNRCSILKSPFYFTCPIEAPICLSEYTCTQGRMSNLVTFERMKCWGVRAQIGYLGQQEFSTFLRGTLTCYHFYQNLHNLITAKKRVRKCMLHCSSDSRRRTMFKYLPGWSVWSLSS